MASAVARRAALSRVRARAGLVVLQVVVDRVELTALLEDAECGVDPMREESKETLARGLEELLRLLSVARNAMDFENVQ